MFEKFVTGINLPWIDDQYDHDFGYNMTRKPDIDYEPNPTFQNSKENFERYIRDISESGVKTVRMWLFERFEGLVIAQDNVMGPDQKLAHNIKEACEIAKKYDVKFYFCLMDTWGFTAGLSPVVEQKYLNLIKKIITQGKEWFVNAAIEVLMIPQVKERTWAVDVLNEPEGLEQRSDDQRRKNTGINWDELMDYVQYALEQIKQRTGLAVSCGFQESDGMKRAKNKIEGLVDFMDFHMYDDHAGLPNYNSLGITKPCIIGECGQETKTWDDEIQKETVSKFLEKSKMNGYSGCFVWEYGFLGIDKSNEQKRWSLINPDGTHRPAFDTIKNFSNS